jgi:hypothetical protein
MSVTNSVDTILVIPYSLLSCSYYINGGERHATTYEKINEILTLNCPNLIYDINIYMSKKIPFFIDIVNSTIQEVRTDTEKALEEIKRKAFKYDLSTTIDKPKIKFQKEKESMFNVLWKKGVDKNETK